MTDAPAPSYCSASPAGSAIEARTPLLGEERFTSAITDISEDLNVARGSRTGAA